MDLAGGITLKVWIDADACPKKVLNFLQKTKKNYGYHLITVSTTNHLVENSYHITVDPSPEAVDLLIVNNVGPKDIVITQDWGLAAIVLGKQARALSPTGLIYTAQRIPFMLEQRNLLARHRRSGGRTKGPSARTAKDDKRFQRSFLKLISAI